MIAGRDVSADARFLAGQISRPSRAWLQSEAKVGAMTRGKVGVISRAEFVYTSGKYECGHDVCDGRPLCGTSCVRPLCGT